MIILRLEQSEVAEHTRVGRELEDKKNTISDDIETTLINNLLADNLSRRNLSRCSFSSVGKIRLGCFMASLHLPAYHCFIIFSHNIAFREVGANYLFQ